MKDLGRLLDPGSIAVAGVSADPAKHGARVAGHLRRLGYPGTLWGVNPRMPSVEGVEVFPSVSSLPHPPDLVVAAVPARAAVEVVADSGGAGGVVVFAGGFAEAGAAGGELQGDLVAASEEAGVRVLGPNSGGVIRPGRGLAASFLTCLDRPPDQIRSGRVGVVTQSGGTGSYLHNLAAARGEGLAISVSTGNEAGIALGEAVGAVSRLPEVEVVVAVMETLRDGEAFVRAVREAHDLGKRVVACRIGSGARGRSLMASHTGALAVPSAVLKGILDSLGVTAAETPGEALDVAAMMAASPPAAGPRVGMVTHSGGAAILLADLAEQQGVELPAPGEELQRRVDPLLDHGSVANPLDMGGIVGGPERFGSVVAEFAGSGRYDLVLAVSTAHPPAHTRRRVDSLLALDTPIPVVHLWMAGDQAEEGLVTLRREGAAVSTEPRAAIRAVSASTRAPVGVREAPGPLTGPLEGWGIPLEVGMVVASPGEATEAADRLGYPVAMKLEAPGLDHRTEMGGVELDLRSPGDVRSGFTRLRDSAEKAGCGSWEVRVQRFRPGVEMIVGALLDPACGPLVSVGTGGVLAEVADDVAFAPAPVHPHEALALIGRLRGRRLLEGFRGTSGADLDALAGIVSRVSRGLVGSDLCEVEINPLIWDGQAWLAVDWLTRPSSPHPPPA